jgi:Tfp pilus assembly protein PilE
MKKPVLKRFTFIEILVVAAIVFIIGPMIFSGVYQKTVYDKHKAIKSLYIFTMSKEQFYEFYNVDNDVMKAELNALSENKLHPRDSLHFK